MGKRDHKRPAYTSIGVTTWKHVANVVRSSKKRNEQFSGGAGCVGVRIQSCCHVFLLGTQGWNVQLRIFANSWLCAENDPKSSSHRK